MLKIERVSKIKCLLTNESLKNTFVTNFIIMKKISFIAILIMATLFACNKEEITSPQPNSNESLESYFKIAGEEHNKGLDYVYQQLRAAKESNQLNVKSRNNVFELVKKSTVDFIQNNQTELFENNQTKGIKYANLEFNRIEQKYQNNTKGSFDNLWAQEITDSLTLKQKELLTVLNEAIKDESLDLDATLEVFEDIRERATTECSEVEYVIILAAIEVGTNSLIYWNSNFEKWKELLEAGQNKASWNWKRTGAADAAGAVTTAIGIGGTAIITGPPGWVAGAVGIATGAVATSAGDAVLQWFGF